MKHKDFIRLSLLLLFFYYSPDTYSQSLKLLSSTPFSEVKTVSIDINHSFYVADKKGNIFQFDSTGKQVNVYSPPISGSVTYLEASRTMNVFVFYRDLQRYLILNRFLTTSNFHDINRELIGYAYMAGQSLDNNLWIFDNFSFSLKKYDLRLQKIIIETPLDLILDPSVYDINIIREYQNKVFLNNLNKEILVFDNLGNHQLTLPFRTNYFNFLNEEIYFLQDNELIFYNTYTQKIRKAVTLNYSPLFTLISNGKVILFNKREITINKTE